MEKYAIDCQNILVGNKLDLINLEKDLEKIIKKYFMTDVPLVITSARSGINVAETFELLIYSFLQEYERNQPEFLGISAKFLSIIGKDENDLMGKLLNIGNVDSMQIQDTKAGDVEASPEVEEDGIKIESIVTAGAEEQIIDKYIPIKHEKEQLDSVKDEIIKEFNNNLTKVEGLILDLKKTPIDSLIDSIDKTKEQIEGIKEDFKSNLQSILNLDKNNEKVD